MAKKKKVVSLTEQNITYTEKERHYTLISLNPNTMEVDVVVFTEAEGKKRTKLPFAHLPKAIKQQIRPL